MDNILSIDSFIPKFITKESSIRRKLYIEDEKRKTEEDSYGEVNTDFLRTQKMEFVINLANESDLQRIEELIHRTNQLNATGCIYSYEEIKNFLHSNNYLVYIAELKDKFGSFGKIGVCLIEKSTEIWTLKLFLMSCRVITRGVGNVLLYYVISEAKKQAKKLYCEFNHTSKNRLMYITLKLSGFQEHEKANNLLIHSLEEHLKIPEYIKLIIQ